MSKFEESARNVIDELLDGCKKILKGSYRSDEIIQKIKKTGFTVNIIKKTFIGLACLLLFFCYGCGNDNPKDVVKSFLSACEKHKFEKASKMCYDIYGGKYGMDKCILEQFDGRTQQKRSCYLEFRGSGSARNSMPVLTGDILVTEKYWLSPREVMFDKNNPNKCKVFVFVERKGVSGKETKARAYEINTKKEVEWDLEKINGKWAITAPRDSGFITHTVYLK